LQETKLIRKYQPTDCHQLLDVWDRASALAHSFLSKEFIEQERHNIPKVYLPVAETWVWETNGQLVGFMALIGNEIGGLFVDPEFQRRGIGGALVEKAQSLRGDLVVEVFEKNLLGRAFYQKMGFQFLRQKFHEETGFEIMRLQLKAEPSPHCK
jgi:putative acetyltransferase